MLTSWLRTAVPGAIHHRRGIRDSILQNSMTGDSVWMVPVGALSILICALGIALRRRWPGPAWLTTLVGLGGYLAAGGYFPAAVLCAAIGMFTLVNRVPPRWAALAWLALAPAFWLRYLRRQKFDTGLWEMLIWVATGMAWAVAPALVGLVIAEQRRSRRKERESRIRQAADEERIRIARDIHDIVGHSLSVIALQSGVALRVLETSPEQARLSLEAIRDTSKRSMAELRQTLAVFRDSSSEAALAPLPGLAEIADLVAGIRATGRLVEFRNTVDRAVPEAVQLVAHRVVQEGLTNAVKHSDNGPVRVNLGVDGQQLVVQVINDGPKMSAPQEGAGLRGMRERVASVSGVLQTLCREEGGFQVNAFLPLEGR